MDPAEFRQRLDTYIRTRKDLEEQYAAQNRLKPNQGQLESTNDFNIRLTKWYVDTDDLIKGGRAKLAACFPSVVCLSDLPVKSCSYQESRHLIVSAGSRSLDLGIAPRPVAESLIKSPGGLSCAVKIEISLQPFAKHDRSSYVSALNLPASDLFALTMVDRAFAVYRAAPSIAKEHVLFISDQDEWRSALYGHAPELSSDDIAAEAKSHGKGDSICVVDWVEDDTHRSTWLRLVGNITNVDRQSVSIDVVHFTFGSAAGLDSPSSFLQQPISVEAPIENVALLQRYFCATNIEPHFNVSPKELDQWRTFAEDATAWSKNLQAEDFLGSICCQLVFDDAAKALVPLSERKHLTESVLPFLARPTHDPRTLRNVPASMVLNSFGKAKSKAGLGTILGSLVVGRVTGTGARNTLDLAARQSWLDGSQFHSSTTDGLAIEAITRQNGKVVVTVRNNRPLPTTACLFLFWSRNGKCLHDFSSRVNNAIKQAYLRKDYGETRVVQLDAFEEKELEFGGLATPENPSRARLQAVFSTYREMVDVFYPPDDIAQDILEGLAKRYGKKQENLRPQKGTGHSSR